jgi:hypothetical protein
MGSRKIVFGIKSAHRVSRGWALTGALAGALASAPAPAATGEQWLAWWHSCPTEGLPACALARQAQALTDHADSVRRAGAVLQLRQDSTPQRWVSVALPGPLYYLGPLDDSDLQLVMHEGPGRSAPFSLLSRSGGLAIGLDAPPVLAPGGRGLVVVAAPQGERPGSITLWQRSARRWVQKWRLETGTDLAYRFQGWRQDGAAVRLLWQRPGCAPSSGRAQLRDGPYGWDLYPEAPASCR